MGPASHPITSLLVAALMAAAWLSLSTSASAGQTCGRGDYWCSAKCGAWNNWCRPACGDWNAWCAGQSLPSVIARMSPRSYFAEPKWHGQNLSDPWYNPELRAKTAKRAKAKNKYVLKQRAKN